MTIWEKPGMLTCHLATSATSYRRRCVVRGTVRRRWGLLSKAGLGSEVRLPEEIDPTMCLVPGSCTRRLADRAGMQLIVSKATVLDSQCIFLPWEASTDVVY